LFVVLLIRSYNIWTVGIYPWQAELIRIVEAINILPEGTRVGVSDSGYPGYRAARQVVNLDGVVNNRAAAAIRRGNLAAYLVDNQIDYIHVNRRYLRPPIMGPDFWPYLQEDGIFQRIVADPASQAAYHRLPDDGKIDLGTPEATRFLGSGWDRAEVGLEGLWANNLSAILYFTPGKGGGDYLLQFSGTALNRPDVPQTVTVSLNDRPIGDLAVQPGAPQHYELTLPAEALQPGLNKIAFTFSHLYTPRELNINMDPRRLAVWFDYIVLQPVE
jgi:hypothetical protein